MITQSLVLHESLSPYKQGDIHAHEILKCECVRLRIESFTDKTDGKFDVGC